MLQLIFLNGGGNLNTIKRLNVLKHLFMSERPTIISISESNLSPGEDAPNIDLENYSFIQNDSLKEIDAIIKRFENPDEIREFEKGKFELLHLPGMVVGKATYKPGWKWSVDVSPLSETKFCNVEHLGMVIEGSAAVAFDKKKIITLIPGDVFYVSPKPHDSWVVGDKDYVSIHFLGADSYAT